MGGGFGPHAPPRPAPPGRAGQDGRRVELGKVGKRDGLARQQVTPAVTAVKSTRGSVVPENARIPALARWAFRLQSGCAHADRPRVGAGTAGLRLPVRDYTTHSPLCGSGWRRLLPTWVRELGGFSRLCLHVIYSSAYFPLL